MKAIEQLTLPPEESLSRPDSDFRAALDEHAIVAITDPWGRIVYANDKFCSISQYSRGELLGQDHRLINSGLHSHEFMRELWSTIGRGRVWKGEIRNRAKDGTFYWVATTIVPFLKPNGKPYQYVSIRTDITERKRVEEEVRRLNENLSALVRDRTAQLESANHELEAFCYSVSHDLRAPVRHIDGFAGLLHQSAWNSLDPKSRHFLEQISASARHMGSLIDDLLAFSRMGRAELRRSSVDLAGLVDETIRQLAPEIQERKISWHKGPMAVVEADASMLRQVLVNLLENAVKYTRPRGVAEISISCDESNAGQTIVSVQDNGVGFDMAYAEQLFGVFQRLHSDSDFEGTGVGLANVRRIISRHGGRVWAVGKVDAGATFYFSLPRGTERNAA